MIRVCLVFKETAKLLPKFLYLQQRMGVLVASHPCPRMMSVFWILPILIGLLEWYFDLICNYLMAYSVEHLYIFGEVSVKVCPIFKLYSLYLFSLDIYFVFGWNDAGHCFQSFMSYYSINGRRIIVYNTYICLKILFNALI